MTTPTITRADAEKRVQNIIATAVTGALDPSTSPDEVNCVLCESLAALLPAVRRHREIDVNRGLDLGLAPRITHILYDADDNGFSVDMERAYNRFTISFGMLYSTFQESSSSRSFDARLTPERLTDRFTTLIDEITGWFHLPSEKEEI